MSFLLTGLLAFTCLQAVPERMEVRLPSGPHPNVFLSVEERDAAQARREEFDWAAKVSGKLLSDADALVSAPLDILHAEGQWSHWYTCAEEGARLKAEAPDRHVCPKCNKVYSGFPYDEVYVTYRHNRWLKGIETLGMAFALEPRADYAVRARDILLEYASFYESLTLHDKDGKDHRSGGRLYAQTLNEAVALCWIAFGYDLLYEADCFSDTDHETIATHLIRPMVDTILNYKAGASNWQSWHNGAIAAAGFLLRDEAMVDFAINDPKNGFLFQMRTSVLPSGMWYEGAPSYHWYALSAHVYLLESAQRAGIDLYALPVVRSLFTGPTTPLFPDMTYPAINDSSRSSIKGAARFYEVAYRRYGDPNFLALREPRNTEYGLFWGAEPPADSESPTLALKTSNDKEGGLAILRSTTRDVALFFNYNPGKHGHTHAAKLDIILYANGDERIVDPGRLAYGNPLHREWYTTTVAHNTVVVDQQTQKRASGIFKAYDAGEEWSVVRAGLDTAYDGVAMERTILMHENVIVDEIRCISDEEHTYDLPLHFKGELQRLDGGEPAVLGNTHGYQHMTNVRHLGKATSEFVVDTGDGTSIWVVIYEHSDVYVGEGRAQPASTYLPFVLRRQEGTRARFTAVYQILGKDEEPQQVVPSAGDTTRIVVGDGEYTISPEHASLTIGGDVVFDG